MVDAQSRRYASHSSLDVLHLSGRIVLVQDSRFAVRTRDGGTKMFTLTRQSALSRPELDDLLGEGNPVTVQYSDTIGGRFALAHRVHRHA